PARSARSCRVDPRAGDGPLRSAGPRWAWREPAARRWTLPPPAALDRLGPNRGLGIGALRPGEVALPGELDLVRLEERRVANEPRPDEHAEADDEDRHLDREIEHEQGAHHEQEERDDPRPEQPLPQLEVEAVAVELPRPHGIGDDQHPEEDQRRDPDGVVEVRKVLLREPDPEVVPRQKLHGEGGYMAGLYSVAHGPATSHEPARVWRMPRVRALLSVASRDGISTFARGLQTLGVEVYATAGTRDHLAQDGI